MNLRPMPDRISPIDFDRDSMEFAGILRNKLTSGSLKTVWLVEYVSGRCDLTLPNDGGFSEGDIIFFHEPSQEYMNTLPDCGECGTAMLQTDDRLICPYCNNIAEFLWEEE